jgi:transglutaminase-like putative cysteine protease
MRLILTPLLLCACLFSYSQKDPVFKFGKISIEDLQKTAYAIDSSANAVVIADIGKSAIEGNTKGWFSLVYTRLRRVHILKKGAYSAADIEIPLYKSGGGEEELSSIKAVTYNLENGKIVETKLEKSGIFTDKLNKYYTIKKFTFPNVKEGSIIEFEYTIKSDFLRYLRSWEFQGKLPRLWSEYNLALPNFLGYVFLRKGYLPYYIETTKERNSMFHITEDGGTRSSEHYTFTSGVVDHRWVMKDVAELKEESFTSTIDNHKAAIEFQLSEFRQPLTPRQFMRTWPDLVKELMEDEDFGKSLTAANNWLSDEMKLILAGATTESDKAHKIFIYLRDNITCTDHDALYTKQPLKNVLKSKKGTVSEINLLLTAMLRYAGIEADPAMLSTKDNGYVYAMYPLLTQYNYVISQAVINGKKVNLDASHTRLGFGKLPYECYNGTGRLINQLTPYAVELSADSLKENKLTSIILTNDEKGKWVGRLNQTRGYYESYNIRDKVKDKGIEELVKDMRKSYSQEISIEQPKFDSLESFENPIGISYQFNFNHNDEDIIYFNPMFAEGTKENPFKSAERIYPVEMPYTFDEIVVVTIETPKGYVVDELPKPVRVKLNEAGEGMFEYLLSESNGTISLRSRIKLNRANYNPDEYELLREFFNLIVSKHSEQIVFKKKK